MSEVNPGDQLAGQTRESHTLKFGHGAAKVMPPSEAGPVPDLNPPLDMSETAYGGSR
jgi:hypothetical protein